LTKAGELVEKYCRNCGSRNLKELGFIGEVASFFLKRVLNMEVKTSLARHPLRLFARRVCALPQRLFAKIYGCSAYVEMQICLDCCFVQTKHAFADDALARLYADYRSASYNRERIHYEPSYAALANDVGVSDREVEVRVGGLTGWLAGRVQLDDEFSMLDYGGSDGRFLPRLKGRKFVFEISSRRWRALSELQTSRSWGFTLTSRSRMCWSMCPSRWHC